LFNLKRTTRHSEIYLHIPLQTIEERTNALAINLYNKNIIQITTSNQNNSYFRNNRSRRDYRSLGTSIAYFCENSNIILQKQSSGFDTTAFTKWKNMVDKKIREKTIQSKMSAPKK